MKLRKSFFTIAVSVILTGLLACTQSINSSQNYDVPEGKVMLSVNIDDPYTRSAIPVIDWDEFKYELIAVQNPNEPIQKEAKTLFSNRQNDELVAGVLLDAGKYKFTLNASKNGQKVLSGVQIVDLSSGNTSLSFQMYPVSGGTGNASIKIRYPMVNPVAKIVAYVSNSIFAEEEGEELTSRKVSGSLEAYFEPKNLPSNEELYANFRFYDENGALVYSGAESLIIVAGCTSRSELLLTEDDWHTYACTVTLVKDGEGWAFSDRKVSLVNKNDSSKVYELADFAGGKFKASVAEGLYYVYVDDEDTGIEFNSVNKNIDVNYYTVSMASVKNSKMVPLSGGLDMEENYAVVQEGKAFTYKLLLSRGYETVSGLTLKQNENLVPGAAFNTVVSIAGVQETTEIVAEGITPIIYTITYSDNGTEFASAKNTTQPYWFKFEDTYVPPETFTAEETVVLPAIENIRKENNFFDAWTDSHGNTVIDTEGIFENLVLNANWRSAPSVDDANKIIYANGFNLLIKATDTKNTQTNIFVDYNGDGIKNNDDYQIKCTNITTGNSNDFSGYELHAGSADGSYVPKSDFTFTMTGGTIAAIYGLNSPTEKYSNKSTLRISGTSVIGNITDSHTVTNADSTTTTFAAEVKGIMLDTLSSERVFIFDQMTNLTDTKKTPYAVTCVTTKNFDRNVERVVAEITNSNYASLANFTCWNVATDEKDASNKTYTQIILSHKEQLVNSVLRTYIRMADNSGVILPTDDEIVWDEVSNEFSIETETINKPCSVFSLAVENGSFRMNERCTITNNTTDADHKVESTLSYMAQPTPLTYVEKLSFEENYVYMQVFSAGDLLTPYIINNFLAQICFSKYDPEQKIKVTLNIETVPSKYIQGEGDGHGGSEFKYFNGSFYKRYQYENDNLTGYNEVTPTKGIDKGKQIWLIKWTKSYANAKQKSFNGLQGYLMNITSEVENNYIYDTFYKLNPDKLSWAGGAAVKPVMTTTGLLSGETVSCWDQDESVLLEDGASVTATTALSSTKNADRWYWQAGPEAGKCFWGTPVIANQADADNGAANRDCDFDRWNNSEFLHNDSSIYDKGMDFTVPVAPTVLLRGRQCKEPNGSTNHTINGVTFRGTGEQYLQFLAGELWPTEKEKYRANGFWNNQGDKDSNNDGYGCTGYIVEFTPYETEYGRQVANYQAIKRSAEY